MNAIQHHFIARLRADADLQYRARTSGGTTWQNLHLPPLHNDCALTTVLQAMMVLEGLPRSHAEQLHRPKTEQLHKLVQLAFEHSVDEGISALAPYLAHVPKLQGELVEDVSPLFLGLVVTREMAAGAVPIVRISRKERCYFALVVGAEVVFGHPEPRALLLLDAYASAPWSTFFNAKLALSGTKRHGTAEADRLAYRLLDGEVHQASVSGLWVIRRAQPP
jgi:hypothetical protein